MIVFIFHIYLVWKAQPLKHYIYHAGVKVVEAWKREDDAGDQGEWKRADDAGDQGDYQTFQTLLPNI